MRVFYKKQTYWISVKLNGFKVIKVIDDVVVFIIVPFG